jgi:RNA polymerase sigma factor (sigma-70 family)
MTDAELVQAARQGDHAAFGVLVERYQRMVEGVAYSVTRRQALVGDIVQDTFVTAWRTLDRLRDTDRVRGWLGAIARNVARNARRGVKRCTTIDELASDTTPFEQLCDHERERDVAAALARLPQRYREPIVLFYYEQCTVKEVAETLALREDAVMQRLSRGRRRLGEELAISVEVDLERKPSRAGLAACLLLLLPVRTASAATAATPARLAGYVRIGAALVACGVAALVMVLATQRSNAIAATHEAPAVEPPADRNEKPKPPALPKDSRSDRVYRNIVVASPDAAESCARGAGALATFASDEKLTRKEGDKLYYVPPSPALQRMIDVLSENAAADCEGEKWPEIYVICEATIFDILDGKATCYPHDPFASDQPREDPDEECTGAYRDVCEARKRDPAYGGVVILPAPPALSGR